MLGCFNEKFGDFLLSFLISSLATVQMAAFASVFQVREAISIFAASVFYC